MVAIGGKRSSARTRTRRRGRKFHGDTATWLSMASSMAEALKSPALPSRPNPTTASSRAGTDVHKDSRIWAKSSDPAAAVARFAVSESGEALSPK
jgi:hypothetical protein